MIPEKIIERTRRMEIFKSISPEKLQGLLDHIRQDVTGWKAVDITVEGDVSVDAADIAEKIETFFGNKDGVIFICGARKVLTLGQIGENIDTNALKEDIARVLPDYACTISTGAITREGLETIAIRLKGTVEKPAGAATADEFLQKRMERSEKVFFVIDDDMFMRSLVSRVLKSYGTVHEFGDGKDLAEHYAREIPDVVFLDIHLPCGSGIDVLSDIMHVDDTASVVMLSADKVKGNVLLAQARGARGFIGKPFTKEKIEEAMRKCVEQAMLLAKRQ